MANEERLVEVWVDGQMIGWARDEEAAQRTVEEYRTAVREAAEAMTTALRALWTSYDPATRARFMRT